MEGSGIGTIESMREGALLGLMVGSAIVLPVLIDTPSAWHKLSVAILHPLGTRNLILGTA